MGFFTDFFSTIPRHVDQKPRYPKSGYKTMDIMTKKPSNMGMKNQQTWRYDRDIYIYNTYIYMIIYVYVLYYINTNMI